jgi:hypothetical protein
VSDIDVVKSGNSTVGSLADSGLDVMGGENNVQYKVFIKVRKERTFGEFG